MWWNEVLQTENSKPPGRDLVMRVGACYDFRIDSEIVRQVPVRAKRGQDGVLRVCAEIKVAEAHDRGFVVEMKSGAFWYVIKLNNDPFQELVPGDWVSLSQPVNGR